MPRSLKVEVDLKVFKWLRESSSWSVEEVAKRLKTSVEVVKAIEKGERLPTLRQLKELSNAYKRPLATFHLSEPLKEPPMPNDYRMLPDKKDVFDKETIYVIRNTRGLQEIGKELLVNIDYAKFFAGFRVQDYKKNDNTNRYGNIGKLRNLFACT